MVAGGGILISLMSSQQSDNTNTNTTSPPSTPGLRNEGDSDKTFPGNQGNISVFRELFNKLTILNTKSFNSAEGEENSV